MLVQYVSGVDDNRVGGRFITNVDYQNGTTNYVWSIAQSKRNSFIIASRTGVFEYNSETWSSIKTPDISLSLLSSGVNDKIYTCGRNHVGYLQQNSFGQYAYASFSGTSQIKGVFTDIFETNSGVYFYSNRELLFYNVNEKALSTIATPDSASTFIGAFMRGDIMCVNILNQGVFEVESGSLTKAKGFGALYNQNIAFNCAYDSVTTLIGCQNGNLLLLNAKGVQPFRIEDESFIQNGYVTDGVAFSESKIAVSFRGRGVLIIDKFTGKTTDIINRENGLPEDYVMSLFVDNSQALWIAHLQGLSRLDVALPIKSYSSYFGIEGSIITSNYWKEKLYVATSDGVFILDSISDYDMKEVYKKIPVISANATEDIIPSTIVEETNDELEPTEQNDQPQEKQKKSRKKFFKNLFTSKEEVSNEDTQLSEPSFSNNQAQPSKKVTKAPSFEYFQYQELVLNSKYFGFSAIDGISERCNKLIASDMQLLAITNSHIYSIDAQKNVRLLFTGSNILDVVLSAEDKNIIYVIDKGGVYSGVQNKGNWEFTLKTKSDASFNITSLAEISEESFLIALNNQLVQVNLLTGDIVDIPLANPYSERVFIKRQNKRIYVLVGASLFTYDKDLMSVSEVSGVDGVSIAYLKQTNQFSVKTLDNTYRYLGNSAIPERAMAALNIFNDIKDIHIDVDNNMWVLTNADEIFQVNSTAFQNYRLPSGVYLSKMQTQNGTQLSGDNLKLKYSENSLTFSFFSSSLLKLNSTQYQYIVEGLMSEWSEWSNTNEFTIPYLPHGNYTLKFKAKNVLGDVSEIEQLRFKVLPPFWKTIYFYVAVIVLVILLFYYWQKTRLKRLIKEKETLKEKVKERTLELQKKNAAITDSINYAGKIQNALLPPAEKLDSILSEYFVYYKPKDIISGDYYLVAERKRYTVVIAADCTGHGVPGAFMSMLGMAYLNEILAAADFRVTAAEVLNLLREKIVTLLHQHNDGSRDGMDMVVLLFDKQDNMLQYAGAHNPLYRLVPKKYKLDEEDSTLVQSESEHYNLLQYKGDKFQVGNSKKSEVPFTNHIIDYQDDEKFYIFSDGYVDQFGGDEQRKYMYGRFRKLLVSNAHKPMAEQEQILDKEIASWKKDNPQTDDILIMGMKL